TPGERRSPSPHRERLGQGGRCEGIRKPPSPLTRYAALYPEHVSLGLTPQTLLRPKSDNDQHDGDRNPESGIELNFAAVGKLAAKNGLPLVPVEKNAKRVQALQQAESGAEVEQQHQYPPENAKFFGRFRKLASVKWARWIVDHGRRQQAYARPRRDGCNDDKRCRANESDNQTCGQRIHSSISPCVGAYVATTGSSYAKVSVFQGGNLASVIAGLDRQYVRRRSARGELAWTTGVGERSNAVQRTAMLGGDERFASPIPPHPTCSRGSQVGLSPMGRGECFVTPPWRVRRSKRVSAGLPSRPSAVRKARPIRRRTRLSYPGVRARRPDTWRCRQSAHPDFGKYCRGKRAPRPSARL